MFEFTHAMTTGDQLRLPLCRDYKLVDSAQPVADVLARVYPLVLRWSAVDKV